MSQFLNTENAKSYSPTLGFKNQQPNILGSNLAKPTQIPTQTPTQDTLQSNNKVNRAGTDPVNFKIDSLSISHNTNIPKEEERQTSQDLCLQPRSIPTVTTAPETVLQNGSGIPRQSSSLLNEFQPKTLIPPTPNLQTLISSKTIDPTLQTQTPAQNHAPTLAKAPGPKLERLNSILDSTFKKKMAIPTASKFLVSRSRTPEAKKTDSMYGSIPNTVSMASIPIDKNAPPHSSKTLGFIDLTSDEGSDEDISFTNLDGLKSVTTTRKVIPKLEPQSTPFHSVEENNTTTSNAKKEFSANINQVDTSVSKPMFKKFSYNDSDDKSDTDEDDDIIITGVSHNPAVSFDDDDVVPIETVKTAFTNPLKRELSTEMNDDIMRKRQEILKNKLSLIEDNVKKEENFQNILAERAKAEKEKIEKERINKLLEKYPPIKALPQKYQIEFPAESDFMTEAMPILPDTILGYEMAQDNMKHLPPELRVTKYRDENLSAMHSVIYRLNKFSDLHSRMGFFLKKTAQMRNHVLEKAIKTSGIKKADIRYNQILRFFDSEIKILSKYYGEIGSEIFTLKSYKMKIIERSRQLEEVRKSYLFNGTSQASIAPLGPFLKTLPELNLVINTITEMYKLTGSSPSETLKTVREFSLTPPAISKIPLPAQSSSYIDNIAPKPENSLIPSHDVIDVDAEEDTSIDGYDNMFYQMDQYVSGRNPSYMPFSNVYDDNMSHLNPYRTNLNDSDGIRNLMESIKITEFKEEGLANTPNGLCISLLKHQRIGLSWMLKIEEGSNKGGILADDMGLGKTVQAIALILANPCKKPDLKTNLIIGPVSLLHQWQQEIAMKVKNEHKLTTYMFHSNNKVSSFEELSKYDVVLVSYQTLGSEWKKHYAKELEEAKKSTTLRSRRNDYKSPFFTTNAVFYRIILDEAQFIKNKNTIASKAVASLSSTYRWCLSGTPIQNRIDELYPLIRFLGIKPYNNWTKFNQQIVLSVKHRNSSANKKIHALLSAILLRRTKDSEIDGQPILTLPEKHVIEEKVEMDEKEKEFYNSLENSSMKTADKLLRSQNKAYSSILTLLLRMRQAADHQYLVRLGDDGDRVSKLDRFKKGFEAVKDYPPAVINRIENERENGFTCLHCMEELAEGQTLLLSKCGHPLCYDCHTEYFEQHSEASWEGDVSAKCTTCGVISVSSMSVDLRVYEAYREGLTWQEIRKKYQLDSRASDKNWRFAMIRKFIEEDGKLMISAKVKKTVDLAEKILNTKPGEKVIVFSQFIGFFDILQLTLRDRNIDYLQYDGSMDMTTKNDCVNAFYKDPSKRVLLLSLKAGNVGLTLTCANHVIIVEPFWNPYVEKQAQDRVHRISQTREVFVHRLLISGTIEDRIMKLQQEKEELVESALDPTARSKIGKLSRRELGFLFGLNGLAELEDD